MDERSDPAEASSSGPAERPDGAYAKPATPEIVDGPVSIIVVTPAMAAGTPAEARNTALAQASRGDRDELAALAVALPWLAADEAFACGCHVRTDGLFELVGAPEFELANVPVAFVPAASRLLQQLAHYVLTSNTVVRDGQVLALDAHGAMALAKGVAATTDQGADEMIPTLRLILLS